MSSFKLKNLRHYFKNFSREDSFSTLQRIGVLRQSTPPEKYQYIIAALTAEAPVHRNLTKRRPCDFNELLYYGCLEPLSLKNELAWAGVWLENSSAVLNEFILLRSDLQAYFVEGRLNEILCKIDDFIERRGWSLWAVELKFATKQQLQKGGEVKQFSSELQQMALNRPASVIPIILADRNDETMSYDAFLAKCKSSFPRFPDEWLKIYLSYRALNYMENVKRDLPFILSTDIGSSLFDYYESLIETLQLITIENDLVDCRNAASELIDILIKNNFIDFRLKKIAHALNHNKYRHVFLDVNPVANQVSRLHHRLVTLQSEPPSLFENEFVRKIHDQINRCDQFGISSQEDVVGLLKLGLNFKGLQIGEEIALKAANSASEIVSMPLVNFGQCLVQEKPSIEDILVFDDDYVAILIREIFNRDCQQCDGTLGIIVKIIDGDPIKEGYVTGSIFFVWLARYLAKLERISDAEKIVTQLNSIGGAWSRHAAKLSIFINLLSNNIEKALWDAALVLIRNFQYAYELPLDLIFKGRKWDNFKGVDPSLVGFVAHHANVVNPISENRFACRMACRAFYKNVTISGLEDAWAGCKDENGKNLLVAFLKEAWTDENLGLIEAFKSTQEVRQDRIKVLQHLLSWDQTYEQEYSAEIRDLTFDETLWRGLKQINEGRIFVNESAISRWAEKELLSDFERWKSIGETHSNERLSNELIRNYLISPDVDILFSALPNDVVTEKNALALSMLDRLLKRFLTDPTDGLDSYLSLRLRHGSLRGTIFGPLEQEGLLLSGESSERAFHKRWDPFLQDDPESMQSIVDELKIFTKTLQDFVKKVIDEKIQIQSTTKPNGAFLQNFSPDYVPLLLKFFDTSMPLQHFTGQAYLIFWTMLMPARKGLVDFFKMDFKEKFVAEFSRLSEFFNNHGTMPLVTTIRTVSTATQSQCDAIAEWFDPKDEVEQQSYSLEVAIEIAKRATGNVYRNFSVEIILNNKGNNECLLSSSGLATLYDCLYVVFANAWKHSGLERDLKEIEVDVEFDEENNFLKLRIENALSKEKKWQYCDDVLIEMRERYLVELPVDLVPKEGGSGFAKLARMVSVVDRNVCKQPLDFGVSQNKKWYVEISIPLFKRDGVFDAYL